MLETKIVINLAYVSHALCNGSGTTTTHVLKWSYIGPIYPLMLWSLDKSCNNIVIIYNWRNSTSVFICS